MYRSFAVNAGFAYLVTDRCRGQLCDDIASVRTKKQPGGDAEAPNNRANGRHVHGRFPIVAAFGKSKGAAADRSSCNYCRRGTWARPSRLGRAVLCSVFGTVVPK